MIPSFPFILELLFRHEVQCKASEPREETEIELDATLEPDTLHVNVTMCMLLSCSVSEMQVPLLHTLQGSSED